MWREEVAHVHGEIVAAAAATAARSAAEAAAASAVGRLVSMQGVLQAIATLLAVRLMLMLALLGGFALAVMALHTGSWQAAGVMVAYAVLVLLPLVWLERNPRVSKPGEV